MNTSRGFASLVLILVVIGLGVVAFGGYEFWISEPTPNGTSTGETTTATTNRVGENGLISQKGNDVTILRKGITFSLPGGWSVGSTSVIPGLVDTKIDIVNASGKVVAEIECPVKPMGMEGEYDAIASSTRMFTKNGVQYQAGYSLFANYINKKLDPSSLYGFFSGVEGGNVSCTLFAFSPDQEDLAGLESISDSWR